MQLYFETDGEGEPLILLHGLFGSGDNWRTIARALADKFRTYRVDQRNHGRSPHRTEMSYPVMSGDLLEFMQQQNLSSVNLLGHSMGGKVAMQFALEHPPKVIRLIIVDVAPRPYRPQHQEILNALLALNLNEFQSRSEIEAALETGIPDLAVRRFLLKSLKRSPEGSFFWQLNLEAINQNYDRLSEGITLNKVFEQPTLFIRGGASDYFRSEDTPLVQKLFPNAELATIANADHWVHSEAPEAFLRTVREFLLRNPASGARASVPVA